MHLLNSTAKQGHVYFSSQHCCCSCTNCKFNVVIANTSVFCGPPLGWESSSNFAELQKGCKIVLGGRAAPYLRVVTNDKYCTSCQTSYQEPDQRLYSTTARVCLSLTQIVGLFIYSELLACSKGPNYSNLRTFSLHSTGISKNMNSELKISPPIINSKRCEMGIGFQACDLPKR